jgi:hypothetical protein
MARVQLVKKLRQVEGSCCYDDISVFSEAKHWYDQDVWQYCFNRLACCCTAWKEIMRIGGYLPVVSWRIVDSIPTPEFDPEHGFVIEERFDKTGRSGYEDVSYVVRHSPIERIVAVEMPIRGLGSEVFVSPHSNLIVGAKPVGEHLFLSSIRFLNVEREDETRDE